MTYFINRNIEKNEFKLAFESDYFVDKTELISKINTIINKKDRFLCICLFVLNGALVKNLRPR